MNTNLLTLEPVSVWKHFSNICALPHPSKHEQKIRKYIVEFAEKLGIECKVDKIGNVILYKPATKGYENRKTITMQAHLDMVPQKNSDKIFNFEKDPIKAYIDGDWVTADGTTLGADNGMGVAAALAIMESNDFEHGPLECLFTIDEEAGMTGAFGLEADTLRGEILLNLDSEAEGELYVGCAGGVNITANMYYEKEDVLSDTVAYEVSIQGLKGGHSGLEIILQRGNSNKIMARFIYEMINRFGIGLASINGGNMRNAIPREGKTVIIVPSEVVAEFEVAAEQCYNTYKSELADVEDGFVMKFNKCEAPAQIIEPYFAYNLVTALLVCPNGVDRMSDAMPGLVESSSNIGIVSTDNDKVSVVVLVRSSVDSTKELLVDRISATFASIAIDCEIEIGGKYSGWKPNMNSWILGSMLKTYEQLYGNTPKVTAIHAGLECGIIGSVYPNMDMISFGPTLCFPHSPDEKVEIASVDKFYKYLKAAIVNAPLK